MFILEEKPINEAPINAEKVEQAQPMDDEKIAALKYLNAGNPELKEGELNEAPPIANAIDSLYGLLSLVPIGLSFAGMKNTAAVWADSTCHGLAAACVPVFRKYAWGQKIIVFLETGGGVEELALMAVVMPIGLATYKAIELDQKQTVTDTEKTAFSESGIEMANKSDVAFERSDYVVRN